ncbi:alpha/beta hydrolase [Kitasatospora aureofaciens]|uniref:alpha/beta hydrolase n=1 Tax=Kitasatospora aureofaciens TaxID=1894 RepID=UPI001C46030C|nr:alpha/beta hydrolase [Kitasatospora aureofaciens]MBV6702032.1 alpha/beta hydrolase [Kitasatospora aureofaciens]
MPIDPIIQKMLEGVPEIDFDTVSPQELRKSNIASAAALPRTVELPRIEDRIVNGVDVRVYWPQAEAGGLPVVVYYHGGGFFMGNLDTQDNLARSIAAQVGAIVVSVDYRLAPEHPYPAAVEDAFAALSWVGQHAAELGGDPARIAVAGDSAGGNLAAMVAIRARDTGGPALRFQLLWYPATALDLSLPSETENADAPVLPRRAAELSMQWYLAGLDAKALGAAPVDAASLAGLPPAYIATVQGDALRDEGLRYVELLRAAGVPVEHRNHDDLVHAFTGLAPVVPSAAKAVEVSLVSLTAALQ